MLDENQLKEDPVKAQMSKEDTQSSDSKQSKKKKKRKNKHSISVWTLDPNKQCLRLLF